MGSEGSKSSPTPASPLDSSDAGAGDTSSNGDTGGPSPGGDSGGGPKPATEASHADNCRRVLEFVQPQLDSCRDTVVNLSQLVLPQDTDPATLEPLIRFILSVHEMYRVCCRLETAFAHTFDSKPPKPMKKAFARTRASWKALVDAVRECTAINQTAVKPLFSFDRSSIQEALKGEADSTHTAATTTTTTTTTVLAACRVCCLPPASPSKGGAGSAVAGVSASPSCVPCANLWINCVSKTLP